MGSLRGRNVGAQLRPDHRLRPNCGLRRRRESWLEEGQTADFPAITGRQRGQGQPLHDRRSTFHNGSQTPFLDAQTTGGSSPTRLYAMPIPPRRKPYDLKDTAPNTFCPGSSDLPYLDRTQHGTTCSQDPYMGGTLHPVVSAAPRIWSRARARKAIPSLVERTIQERADGNWR